MAIFPYLMEMASAKRAKQNKYQSRAKSGETHLDVWLDGGGGTMQIRCQSIS